MPIKEKLDLGEFTLCLSVKDIYQSRDFYEKLDFEIIGGDIEQDWLILQHNNLILSLFQGHINEKFLLNFRKGAIFDIRGCLGFVFEVENESFFA